MNGRLSVLWLDLVPSTFNVTTIAVKGSYTILQREGIHLPKLYVAVTLKIRNPDPNRGDHTSISWGTSCIDSGARICGYMLADKITASTLDQEYP